MSGKKTLDQYLSLEPIFDICIFGGQYSTVPLINIFSQILFIIWLNGLESIDTRCNYVQCM
jgi:hypothetical protein